MYGCQPKDSSIQIEERTAETYAMLEFPGICTNAEIDRKRELLKDTINEQKKYVLTDDTNMVVLQYNAPATLPWRRKNQIGFPVKLVVEETGETTDEKEEEEDKKADEEIAAEQTEPAAEEETKDSGEEITAEQTEPVVAEEEDKKEEDKKADETKDDKKE